VETQTGAEKGETQAAPADEVQPEPIEATSASPGPVDDDEPTELPKSAAPSGHGRTASVAAESRLRSASFYRGGDSGTPTSPGTGISGDIFREQAHKIEELERENKRLQAEVEEGERRWKKGEEELEELREGQSDIALAVQKGQEADALVCPPLCESFPKSTH
jgi:hypothetical protein